MLNKSEIEMLAHSTADELVSHLRTLTPRMREAQHTMKRAKHEFDRLACLVSAARAMLLMKRIEKRNHNNSVKIKR
jgi:hypothetical protein